MNVKDSQVALTEHADTQGQQHLLTSNNAKGTIEDIHVLIVDLTYTAYIMHIAEVNVVCPNSLKLGLVFLDKKAALKICNRYIPPNPISPLVKATPPKQMNVH